MTRDDRFYTFIIARTSRFRRISLHQRWLQAFICLASGILCLALYGVYGLSQQITRLHLERENKLLRQQTEKQREQLNNLENRIGAIEDASRRLAETSRVQEPPISEARGAGGPSLPIEETTITAIEDRATQLERTLQTYESVLRERAKVPSIWPVQGWITDRFGVRRNPFDETLFEFHAGQDIAAEWGSPVVAAGSGTVVFADTHNGYGRLVIVDHGNGVTTRYGHLSTIDVVPDQIITRGQPLGRVGSTGRSTGPHLHYEVRINDNAVNPRRYLPPRA